MYLVAYAVAKISVESFFREITVLNPERIPAYGPVIFVGNHNNQFVDASMLLAMLPRRVRFLVAEKSLKRSIIGSLARSAGCIAVARPQDKRYRGLGNIRWDTGTLTIHGVETRFLLDVHVGDSIVADGISLVVEDIISDSELAVKEPLPEMPGLKGVDVAPPVVAAADVSRVQSGSTHATVGDADERQKHAEHLVSFSVVPRVDQSEVYEAVSDALVSGESIGIFPEGGSHDQTQLLPLKPGVAIMALRAAIEGAEDVMIVPIGLTYYQAHRILSRAIIQVGKPLTISEDLVELYEKDRRKAVSVLLADVEKSMKQCIVSATEYKVLKAIRLCATLYVPESMMLPPDKYYALYYRLSSFSTRHQQQPMMIETLENIQTYANLLKSYGIADHEVRQLKQNVEDAVFSFMKLSVVFLLAILIGVPFVPLWGPIRACSSYLAEQHRRKALAESKVKITANDVVASYKILTMIVFVPAFNFIYGLMFGLLFCSSWSDVLGCIVFALCFLPIAYYYSIRQFAKIVPLLRKFRFLGLLVVSKLNAWRDTEREIITARMNMQLKVRTLVDHFGALDEEARSELERCVPQVVIAADTKRIVKRLVNGEFVPISGRTTLENREEIL